MRLVMKKYTKSSRKRVVNRMSDNDRAFLKHVKDHCKSLGVKCIFKRSASVKYSDGVRCSGWFDSENRELVVGMKNPIAFHILVHEYAHLTQWVDNAKVWVNVGDSLEIMDRWLQGEDFRDIKKHLARVRDLELDNEQRSVSLIKEWNLSIDPSVYIKGANAYVHYYNWIYYTRKWSKPKNSPYRNQIILNAMSTRFNMNYKKMSKKVHNAFIAANI